MENSIYKSVYTINPDIEDAYSVSEMINPLLEIINNDYAVYKNGKKYTVNKTILDFDNNEIIFFADCDYLGEDSYGVPLSEFPSCFCKDYNKCKYAGEYFDHEVFYNKEPTREQCGCLISFYGCEIGKEITFKEK